MICPEHTINIREAIVHGALHLVGMDHEVDDGEMLTIPGRTALIVVAALRNPNAGEILVSAAAGYEFADLGGRDQPAAAVTARSWRGDSEVRVLLAGIEGEPRSIVDFAPLATVAHFGVSTSSPSGGPWSTASFARGHRR